jgi:hypothetical protein
MTVMASQGRRFRAAMLLLAPACSMLPHVAYAQTEPRVVVDVSVVGTGDSNPFLITNGESSFSATLKVDPKVYWEDESSSFTLDGGLRVSQYSNRYGSDIGGRVGVEGDVKIDERTSLFARAGYQSSRSTLQDNFFANIGSPLDPGPFPEVSLTDVTIAGRRIRVNTLDASVGINRALSAADTIGITASTSYSKFGGNVGSDYRTGSVGLQYGRQLSERTTVTAALNATVADYIGINAGDAKIISPQIGIQRQLSESLKWSASLGISYASVDDQFRISRQELYASGDFSLCSTGLNRSLCGSVSRGAAPTALGGISAVTNVSFNYDQKLSLKDSFSMTGRYGRTDQSSDPAFAALRRNSQILGASATYTRDVNERFSIMLVPSYTRISEKQLRKESNYSVMVGVKFRFGKLR